MTFLHNHLGAQDKMTKLTLPENIAFTTEEKKLINVLKDRGCLYHLMDRGNESWLSQEDLRKKLNSMPGILDTEILTLGARTDELLGRVLKSLAKKADICFNQGCYSRAASFVGLFGDIIPAIDTSGRVAKDAVAQMRGCFRGFVSKLERCAHYSSVDDIDLEESEKT